MIKQNQECTHPRIFKTFAVKEEKKTRMMNKEKNIATTRIFFLMN